MGDMSEALKAVSEGGRILRQERRDEAVAKLNAAGIAFRDLNHGAHLRVTTSKGRRIELFPSSGKWRVLGTSNFQYGIESFIEECRKP